MTVDKSSGAVIVFIVASLVIVLSTLITSWAVMLLSGALGHIFEAPKLFLSYTESIVIAAVIMLISNLFRGK